MSNDYNPSDIVTVHGAGQASASVHLVNSMKNEGSAALLPAMAEPEPLSPPDLDHPAHELREVMLDKMDESADKIIAQLNQLVGQIEQIKNTVLRRTAALKGATEEHFDLVVEVLGWKEQVARRLLDWVHGEARNGQES